jgi:hypothetical protein
MARGRLILRTLGSSRKYADTRIRAGKLGEFAQSLYPLLVANSDDYGRMAGDAFTVKFAMFPTSPRCEADFNEALEAMRASGLIERYTAEGKQLIQIVDFDRGQPNLHKRTPSVIPEFPGFSGISGNPPEVPSQSNLTKSNSIEPNSTALRAVDGFSDFWDLYPKKKSRVDAEKAWRKLAPSPELSQRIKAAVAVQLGSEDWRKEGGKFIPYPASWLNGRRWEDEVSTPRVSRPTAAETDDWFLECAELHNGDCGGSLKHRNRMLLNRESA